MDGKPLWDRLTSTQLLKSATMLVHVDCQGITRATKMTAAIRLCGPQGDTCDWAISRVLNLKQFNIVSKYHSFTRL